MSETTPQYRTLTLDQSLAFARWYANELCLVKPEVYETYSETAEGTSRLSDAVRVIVDALASAQEELEAVREPLRDVVRLFQHYQTVPCLSDLLGEDRNGACECAGCMARNWMATHSAALVRLLKEGAS